MVKLALISVGTILKNDYNFQDYVGCDKFLPYFLFTSKDTLVYNFFSGCSQ